jgi:hypothetical protein
MGVEIPPLFFREDRRIGRDPACEAALDCLFDIDKIGAVDEQLHCSPSCDPKRNAFLSGLTVPDALQV